MPIHDWTRVKAGIFHDFRHSWIEQIKRALNSGILPPEYYALAEQQTARIESDVLALRDLSGRREPWKPAPNGPSTRVSTAGLQSAPLRVRIQAESEPEIYRRLEETYNSAFEAVPMRWRRVVAGEG